MGKPVPQLQLPVSFISSLTIHPFSLAHSVLVALFDLIVLHIKTLQKLVKRSRNIKMPFDTERLLAAVIATHPEIMVCTHHFITSFAFLNDYMSSLGMS